MKEFPLKVVSSQNLNALVDALIEEFFVQGVDLFASRLIVVPHLGMKEFLINSLTSRLDIASGVQILPLHQAVMELVDRSDLLSTKKIPSSIELSLAIAEHLLTLEADEKLHLDLSSPQKVTGLAGELCKVFTRYGLFSESFLSSWLKKQGWQQEIWKSIFKNWTYPLEFFSDLAMAHQGQIALFGFSYVDPLHLKFFTSMKASCYLFCPSAVFWEDLVSDQERLHFDRMSQRRKVSLSTREQLQSYLLQGHSLLANWGKMGRQMASVLQQSVLDEEDRYCIPDSLSLLSSLQRSILTLDETECLTLDASVQVHSATSRLREVEVLRDVIEGLLQKDATISPGEIVVLAPDLSFYVPFIKQVFGSSSLPFVIESKEPLSEEVRGFLSLIDLPKNRYDLHSVTELLECRPFREKVGFSLEEVDQLLSWFKKARILFDLSGPPQSWKEGLDRLLYGLVQIPSENSCSISCIPHSEIETFSRFLKVFSEIEQDLLSLKKSLSLQGWLTLFLDLKERYFLTEEKRSSFFSEMISLKKSASFFKSQSWVFESVYPYLHSLAQKSQERPSLFSKGKIVFSSLETTPLKPAKVIWCLGLDEESFPRVEMGTSLEAVEWKSVECPRLIDEDRFAFLEMVMKATDYLFFSYERIDVRDSKEKGVCLLVEELNSYLKTRGIQDGLQPIHHPGFFLEATYFSKESEVKRWSVNDYLAAKAYYSPPEKQEKFFSEGLAEKQEEIISISNLKKCARSPLQLYFNQTLQLFLKEEESEENEEFVLSALKKSLFRKEGFQKPFSSLIARIEAEGKLPLGGFQEAASYELQEEIETILGYLNKFAVKQEEITSVHFRDCLEREGQPLLRVGSFAIQGELEGVTPQGLLFHGTSDLKDIIKVWPLYLIYLHLFPQTPYLLLTKEGTKICLPVSDPQSALQSYLNFYQEALIHPCPMTPLNVKTFLENDLSSFSLTLEKQTEDVYWQYIKRRGIFSELEELFPFWQPKITSLVGINTFGVKQDV